MDLPPEYVLHLLPLMAICGIHPPQPLAPVSSTGTKPTERSSNIGQLGSPRHAPSLASIPYVDQNLGSVILKAIDQWRTLALWEPLASKDRQIPGASLEGIFRIIPVDRSFRLPPQKVRVSVETEHPEKEKEQQHSPLSPLTPDSPLYPDGIMTTMWIRKHRDIIPAIFVSFYELKSEDKPDNISDEDLARHLAELKKSYADRGVKLCAVVTGPWEHEINGRMEYLRRNSSLDSKTGLFYLPHPQNETAFLEFFRTLRQSQYPYAVEHYRLRFNKTKRRRPRIPPALLNQPPPLDAKGWSIRINFKLATYSEYKQELDAAIKYYELAYSELIDLFSSTASLPPRTKRWTEARLCKLYLYLRENTRVISTFIAHNKRMSALCNGWGLGAETADYWRWTSRNYRNFADLLNISETIVVGEHEIEEAIKVVTGDVILNSDMVLHHPGYYYLQAAECVQRDHAKLSSQEVVLILSKLIKTSGDKTNEDVVDLNTKMFDNLSLSLEQFLKRGSRRTAAYVELARCKSRYYAGKYDVILESLQPVIQIYRAERWFELLEEALLLGLDCAKQIDDMNTATRFFLELMSDNFSQSDSVGESKLPSLDLSQTSVAEDNKIPKIVINATEIISFVQPSFTFESKSTFAGSPVSFQLALQSNARKSFPPVTFQSIQISFSEQIPEMTIVHKSGNSQTVQKPSLGGTSDLSLQPGQLKVLEFSYVPSAQAQIEVMTVSLSLVMNGHAFTIEFPGSKLNVATEALWITESSNDQKGWLTAGCGPNLLRLGNPGHLIVHPKPPKVGIFADLHGPAYTGEKLPIVIKLENGEDETVNLQLHYTSSEVTEGGQASFSWLDTTDSRSDGTFLPAWDIHPGQQKQCTLFLQAPLAPTDCSLNIVANYSLASDKATQICKTLLLDIPIIQPFHINFDIRPCLSTDGMPDFFNEGESLLRVSQSWLLRSSLNRLGSDKLEMQRMQITGDFQKEEMALRIYDDNKTCSLTSHAFVLDTAPYTTETKLVLIRLEHTDTTLINLELAVSWRRQSSSQAYEWNSISIPIPELTFLPFAPRILADVTPHVVQPDFPQYLVTYVFENPTPNMLRLEVHIESTEESAFAGQKLFRLGLLPFQTYEMKMIILPLKQDWVRLPRLTVLDEERKRMVDVLRMSDDLKNEGVDLLLKVSPSR